MAYISAIFFLLILVALYNRVKGRRNRLTYILPEAGDIEKVGRVVTNRNFQILILIFVLILLGGSLIVSLAN